MEAIKQKLGTAEIDNKLRYFVTYVLSLDFFKGRWFDRCVCEAIQSSSSFTTFIKNLNRICDFNYSADAEKIKSLVG